MVLGGLFVFQDQCFLPAKPWFLHLGWWMMEGRVIRTYDGRLTRGYLGLQHSHFYPSLHMLVPDRPNWSLKLQSGNDNSMQHLSGFIWYMSYIHITTTTTLDSTQHLRASVIPLAMYKLTWIKLSSLVYRPTCARGCSPELQPVNQLSSYPQIYTNNGHRPNKSHDSGTTEPVPTVERLSLPERGNDNVGEHRAENAGRSRLSKMHACLRPIALTPRGMYSFRDLPLLV